MKYSHSYSFKDSGHYLGESEALVRGYEDILVNLTCLFGARMSSWVSTSQPF